MRRSRHVVRFWFMLEGWGGWSRYEQGEGEGLGATSGFAGADFDDCEGEDGGAGENRTTDLGLFQPTHSDR